MKAKKNNPQQSMSRRTFLTTTAKSAVGITVLPSHVISGLGHTSPSDKLNIAGIGIGGKGKANLANMIGQNIVALCDVDWDYAAPVFRQYPGAEKYKDFRRMLDKQKDIDACVIATPDHTHFHPAIKAMTMGKHVYLQKPLTHSVWESRQLAEAAKKYKVATQMGNEGHSNDNVRKIAEIIWNGTIGEVREAHAWSDRPIWPQGLEPPEKSMEVPDSLDWDLFIGPAADRPYHSDYHPWSWRAWWDFGTGALGDMGCHILDTVFYALKLKYPTHAQASSTLVYKESAPNASQVEYTFPPRSSMREVNFPEVKVTWHDGGLKPPRPDEMPPGESMGAGGNLFIGTRGKLICDQYGVNYRLLPVDKEYSDPPEMVERIPDHSEKVGPWGKEGGRHEMDWVRACKESPENRREASSNFEYAGPLTEMVLMGNLAMRLQGLHKKLAWDGEKMEFKNIRPEETLQVVTSHEYKKVEGRPRFHTDHKTLDAYQSAREWVRHTYRNGWEWDR
ncbi:MAG: Gfo/Idh/MocA family oxidoreductase [Bacteroidales bacterium]